MGDRRRPRSPSPDRYRRDRSPPYEKRFRGDEYDRGVGGGRGRRGGYARGPEDRRRTGRDEPVSFREFALSLDDSVGVEEAGVQYKQYLADFWGGSVKAEFEQRKNDPSLRQQFDPRELRKALEQRWEAEARRAARLTQRREAAAPPAPASRGEPEAAEPSAADSGEEAAADAPAPDDTPPAPAVSEARDGSEAGAPGAAEAQAFQGRLHRHWQHRLDHGEAAQAAMREEYVEAGVTQFIEDAIVKHEDNKWGNKLSAKLFVAREFVEKHIRNKHAHVLQAERERLQDIVYWENFQSFKQEEKRRREEARGAGRQRGPQGARGMGRPRGGGRHGPEGGHMVFDQGMVMGPGGPGMLVPRLMMPGAGGAMPPVIMAPMNMVLGHMGAGGRGGGRGGNRGGRGGGGRGGFNGGPIFMAPGSGGKPGGPAPNQEYFDLDAPKNNRAVLDYGDL
ncbi:hypothetical protein APUTEX25_002009 [Auxenochlorella protothecoides]|uniref:SERRATE/Ars2 N-terminal domain-containing protein n=1 Tax=Auxenochlorella protothecoides TaxID=3075 RepID=A0A3M7KV85_AUXPR|nr:hypothetical protein APUTEX25_002009 [Auxenochlorella protothecoides]|eukprot:RMZ54433.1 hypothetical protein APUTEX25_002009 [Auxenochlorella protothecoides]